LLALDNVGDGLVLSSLELRVGDLLVGSLGLGLLEVGRTEERANVLGVEGKSDHICDLYDFGCGRERGGKLQRPFIDIHMPRNEKYRIIASKPYQLPLCGLRPSFAEFCPFYDSPRLLSYQFLGNTRPSNCFRSRMRPDRLHFIYLELYSPSRSRTDSGQHRPRCQTFFAFTLRNFLSRTQALPRHVLRDSTAVCLARLLTFELA
jgi:hypothetical protein